MAELETKFIPYSEAREWGNLEGVWQIITPQDDMEISHRSIHFGRRIKSYENGAVVREANESLYVYEVSSDTQVIERQPTPQEASFFLDSLKENLPEHPLTLKLDKQIASLT